MPETPPATCHTVVRIDCPQYRDAVVAALGIVTRDIGLTFEEGPNHTLRFEEASPIPVPGYEHIWAVFNGDVIYFQKDYPPGSHRKATHTALHEIAHWMRMEHNRQFGSIMNLGTWPSRARFTKKDIATAKRLTAYCGGGN